MREVILWSLAGAVLLAGTLTPPEYAVIIPERYDPVTQIWTPAQIEILNSEHLLLISIL